MSIDYYDNIESNNSRQVGSAFPFSADDDFESVSLEIKSVGEHGLVLEMKDAKPREEKQP